MESNVAQLPLSQKALAWFESNKKPAAVAVGVCLVLGVVIAFFIWQRGQREIAASNALSNITSSEITGGARQPSPEALLKLTAQYPNSSAGARALLLAGGEFFTEGKFPEARTQFERFTREYHDSPFLAEALLGVASCLEAEGKTDQAVSAYKELIARHSSASVIPQAKFALARLYEQQNKPELARDNYEDVERSSGFTTLGNEAGMRLEELKAKYPSLNPPPPAPAPKPGPVSIQPAVPVSPATNTAGPATVPPAPAAPVPTPPAVAPAPAATAPANASTNLEAPVGKK